MLAANTIAENVLSQVDDHGHRQLLIEEIIGHRKNDKELTRKEATIVSKGGINKLQKTTKGWELFVQWKDG